MKSIIVRVVKVTLFATMLAMLMSAKCGVSENDPGSPTVSKAADMRLTDDISGWTEESNSYAEFDAQAYNQLVNGDAPIYVSQGLVEGIEQSLANASNNNAKVDILDFSTAEKTITMFNVKKADENPKPVGSYSQDNVFCVEYPDAITVYAAFSKFLFVIKLTGYSDLNNAKSDAVIFLSTYDSML
jgi:hypothetical protein